MTRSPVEVRHYASVVEFQVDVAAMAAAGWKPIAQAETTGGANGATVALGVIIIVVGLLILWPLAILGVLVLILGAVNRRKQLVVTYHYAP